MSERGVTFTRRGLLGSGLASIAATGALGQTAPELETDFQLVALPASQPGYEVTLRGHPSLQVRAASFGPAARVVLTDHRTITIRLIQIARQGTDAADFDVTLQVRFRWQEGRWRISYTLYWGRIHEPFSDTESLLADFLDDVAPQANVFCIGDPGPAAPWKLPRIVLDPARGSLLATELFGNLVRLDTTHASQLALRRDLSFYWFAASAGERLFSIPQLDLTTDALRLGIALPNSGPCLQERSDPQKLPEGGDEMKLPDKVYSFVALGHALQRSPQSVPFVLDPEGGGHVMISRFPGERGVQLAMQRWQRAQKGPATPRGEMLLARWGESAITVEHDRRVEGPLRAVTSQITFERNGLRPWHRFGKFELAQSERFTLRTRVGRLDVATAADDRQLRLRAKDERAKAKLVEFSAPLLLLTVRRKVPGVDYSRLESRRAPFQLLHVDNVDNPDGLPPHYLLLGAGAADSPRARLSLDNACLRVQRSRDLLDLEYTFKDLDLLLLYGKTSVAARPEKPAPPRTPPVPPAAAKGSKAPAPAQAPAPAPLVQNAPGVMVVHLPPQHVAEQAHAQQTLELPDRDAGDEPLQWDYGIAKSGIAGARLSGRSRVAFVVKDEPVEFWADDEQGLTDLKALKLSVVQRARFFPDQEQLLKDVPEKDLEGKLRSNLDALTIAELKHFGVKEGTEWGARLANVKALMAEPSGWQTSIELPYRLMLSPDDTAHFLTPLGLLKAEEQEKKKKKEENKPDEPDPTRPRTSTLWRMELVQELTQKREPRHGVRAIWSPDFRNRENEPFENGGIDPSTDFVTAMGQRDRHEIVALSSMHGLPVQNRRRPADKTADNAEEKALGNLISPPKDYVLKDHTGKDQPKEDVVIYRPQPLRVREMTLTSLGGSLTLDSSFEPPAGVGQDFSKKLAGFTFDIERWRQVTVLGRDSYVEIVKKGFLFPSGHRCARLEITQREFREHPKRHRIAALIRREFITIGKPDKFYPAYSQPDAGRCLPAGEIEIMTGRTPELAPSADPAGATPDDIAEVTPNGRIVSISGEPLVGDVYWPRVFKEGRPDLAFELKIDHSARLVQLPMIFVSNRAAQHIQTMRLLQRYYNNLSEKNDPRVRIEHRGVDRCYAAEAKLGDTTFETESWVMAVDSRSPRRFNDMSDAAYHMDALMEGADQPPFYPALRRATIRLKQVERLTGSAAFRVEVEYLRDYLKSGFGGTANPAEIYLKLLDEIDLNFGRSGDRAGGIGQPSAPLSFISRERGPTTASPPAKPQPAGANTVAAASPPQFEDWGENLDKFKSFNPASFFGGDAKLLGIISFADLLSAVLESEAADKEKGAFAERAPQLKEMMHFGAVNDTIKSVMDKLEVLIAKFWPRTINQEVLGKIYPDLVKARGELSATIAKAKTAIADNKEIELFEACGAVVQSGRRLATVAARITADPVGPLKEAAQKQLTSISTAARAVLQIDEIRATLDRLANDVVPDAVRKAIEARLTLPELEGWRRTVFALPQNFDIPATTVEIDKLFLAAVADYQKPGKTLLGALGSPDELKVIRDALATKIDDIGKAAIEARRKANATEAELKDLADKIEKAKAANRVPDDIRGLIFEEVANQLPVLAVLPEKLLQFKNPEFLATKAFGVGEFASELRKGLGAYAALKVKVEAKVCESVALALLPLAQAVVPKRPPDERCQQIDASAQSAPGTPPPRGTGFACSLIAWSLSMLQTARRLIEADASTRPPEQKLYLDAYVAALEPMSEQLATLLNAVAAALVEIERTRDAIDTLTPDKVCVNLSRFPIGEISVIVRQRVILLARISEAVQGTIKHLNAFNAAEQAIAGIPNAQLQAAVDAVIAPRRSALMGAVGSLVEQVLDLLQTMSSVLAKPLAERQSLVQAFDGARGTIAAVQPLLGNHLQSLLDKTLKPAKGIEDAADEFRTQLRAVKMLAQQMRNVPAAATFANLQLLAQATAKAERALATFNSDVIPPRVSGVDIIKKQIVRDYEQLALEALARVFSLGEAFIDDVLKRGPIEELLHTLLSPIVETLFVITDRVHKVRNYLKLEVARANSNDPAAWVIRTLLGGVVMARLDVPLRDRPPPWQGAPAPRHDVPPHGIPDAAKMQDGLDADRDTLLYLQKELKAGSGLRDIENVRKLLALLDIGPDPANGAARGPAVAIIANELKQLAERLLRGDLAGLIDLTKLQAELVDQLKSLVPSKVELKYDYAATIKGDLGDLKEIFDLDLPPNAPATARQLVLNSHTVVDVLKGGAPETKVNGSFPPFKVALFGKVLNAVTLHFDGPVFESNNGQPPNLKLRVRNVEIGEQLKFLEDLKNSLGLGEDTGLGIDTMREPIGIRVRYGIGIGTIGLGAASFLNVNLNASVALPFESGPAARFMIALSSRDNPFMISIFPFGGGGYFGLEADAKKLIAFEASFDFGGVAAFGFGPLQGMGRLTTGLFVRKTAEGSAELEGQFYAGGSARIACFGVSAALSVRMRQANGGQMCGSAYYTFGFRVLIKTIEFTVPVWRQEGKGFHRDTADAGPHLGTRFAALGNGGLDAGVMSDAPSAEAMLLAATLPRPTDEAMEGLCYSPVGAELGVVLTNKGHCQGIDYPEYAKYFDPALDPDD